MFPQSNNPQIWQIFFKKMYTMKQQYKESKFKILFFLTILN